MNCENLNDIIQECIKPLLEHKENIILQQLNDLVSRGLLVVEQSEPVIVSLHQPGYKYAKLELKQTVKLLLKDKEYIEKLEKENKDLKETIQKLLPLRKDYDNYVDSLIRNMEAMAGDKLLGPCKE